MPTSTTDLLPTIDGRRPRIAFVVYNDTYADTRVLKIAATVADAGADVRIFAFSSRTGHFGPGLETGPVEIDRVPLREIAHLLTRWGLSARRLLGRPVPTYAPTARTDESVAAPAAVVSSSPQAAPAGAPAASVPSKPAGAKNMAIDLWRRADATIKQGSFWIRARSHMAAWGPDLIHAHDANTLVAALSASRRLGIPYVYDSHELWTERNIRADRPVAKRFERLYERIGAKRAGAVVTVSPSIADWLKKRFRLKARPVLVRNIPLFTGQVPEPSAGRLRELAALTSDDRVLAYCGGITTNRGIEETIDALPLLPESVHFVLLGFGSEVYRAGLDARVRRLGLTDRVHFVGAVPSAEVSTALADADVSLVLTRPACLSYEYSLPNKLFESIQAGLPIVATDLVDAAALVRQYDVGEIVATDMPASALAEAITAALASTDERRASIRRAAPELTWQGESARLLGVYRSLLTGRRGSGTRRRRK
ncbi:glycosyltransferase involved in cell wall biosynthesis [Mycetocola sp. CAN_C7]|uniref:glycosyltransferase n=1 Tax=Mycetocola sp. CAN_C7 TaxID=2787724 RepID=UPI0018CA52FF